MNDENLRPFNPGEDSRRNLEGRPKGSRNISSIIRDMLNEEIDVIDGDEKMKKLIGEVIARKLIKKASEGNIKAIQEILDRTEGKARQFVDQINNEEITIKVVRE